MNQCLGNCYSPHLRQYGCYATETRGKGQRPIYVLQENAEDLVRTDKKPEPASRCRGKLPDGPGNGSSAKADRESRLYCATADRSGDDGPEEKVHSTFGDKVSSFSGHAAASREAEHRSVLSDDPLSGQSKRYNLPTVQRRPVLLSLLNPRRPGIGEEVAYVPCPSIVTLSTSSTFFSVDTKHFSIVFCALGSVELIYF